MSFYTDDCKTGTEAIARAKATRRLFASLRAPSPPPPPAVELPPPPRARAAPPPARELPSLAATQRAPIPPPLRISQSARIPVKDVIEMTALHFGLTVNEITSPGREARIVRPRQVGFYIASKLTPVGFKEIGRRFGLRDHSSVIHGCDKIQAALEAAQPETMAAVEKLMGALRAIYPKAAHPPPRHAAIAPSATYPANGLRWSAEEKALLVKRLRDENKSRAEVARELGRTDKAVMEQAIKLGLYERGKYSTVKPS